MEWLVPVWPPRSKGCRGWGHVRSRRSTEVFEDVGLQLDDTRREEFQPCHFALTTPLFRPDEPAGENVERLPEHGDRNCLLFLIYRKSDRCLRQSSRPRSPGWSFGTRVARKSAVRGGEPGTSIGSPS